MGLSLLTWMCLLLLPLFSSWLGIRVGESMGLASNTTVKNNLTENPDPLALQNLSAVYPEPWVQECFVSMGTWLQNYAF